VGAARSVMVPGKRELGAKGMPLNAAEPPSEGLGFGSAGFSWMSDVFSS
jgi:hypothetical protein